MANVVVSLDPFYQVWEPLPWLQVACTRLLSEDALGPWTCTAWVKQRDSGHRELGASGGLPPRDSPGPVIV